MNKQNVRSSILTAVCFLASFGTVTPEKGFTAPITLTGEELYQTPFINFPTTTPTLDATSIQFGAGQTQFEKLFEIPLYEAGKLTAKTQPIEISISINMTRLTNDWDPHLLLSDGSSLAGVVIADNTGGQALSTEMTDLGKVGQRDTLRSILSSAGYPEIGESFDVDVTFKLDNLLTTIDVSFLSGSAGFSSSRLDRTAGLSFVFIRDNDIYEQYQVNSITIDAVSIPEPETLMLIFIGLAFVSIKFRFMHHRYPAKLPTNH